jgi:hypothetical protein
MPRNIGTHGLKDISGLTSLQAAEHWRLEG